MLLDGAMGTRLSAQGFELRAPLFSARALLDAPQLVAQLHWQYLRAGAQLLTTNSFNLHVRTLAAAGLGERQAELIELSVKLLEPARQSALTRREGADPGLARFRIAGSLPPRPRAGRDAGDRALARAEYGQFAQLLASAGADLILLETFSELGEARLALEGIAARQLELPVWLSVVAGAPAPGSSRPDGTRLASGEPLSELSSLFEGGAALRPDALALNCTQLDAVPAAITSLAALPAGVPLGLSPHLSKRRYDEVWIERIVEGDVFAEQMHAWLRALPRFVIAGACCGSRPEEIGALRRWLQPDEPSREQAYMQLAQLLP